MGEAYLRTSPKEEGPKTLIEDFLKDFLEFRKINELTPPQKQAVPEILSGSDRSNIVVAAPTGSGKTLIGEIAIAESISLKHSKAAYLVPLKSLAREKYEDLMGFKTKYGCTITFRTGDHDSDESDIRDYDIVVSTYEKWDSMSRKGPDWMKDFGTIIIDEAHMITDPTRGPTLECMIVRMRLKYPFIRLVLLSAVMPNCDDIASWLDAKLVESTWRAVPLKIGVYSINKRRVSHFCGSKRSRAFVWKCRNNDCVSSEKGTVDFTDGTEQIISGTSQGSSIPLLCVDTLEEGGQVIVFAKSRYETIRLAEIIAKDTSRIISKEEQIQLQQLVESNKFSTSKDKKNLGWLISHGVAYHNAGMGSASRRIVEDGFRRRLIQVIVATPTLAAGVNLPARRVIIQSFHRMTRQGRVRISRWEIENQMGRAGRRAYDLYGEAILLEDEDEVEIESSYEEEEVDYE